MSELWNPIKDFEKYYEVSSLGEVKSLDRTVGYRIKGTTRRMKGKKMKQKMDKFGYMNVCLCKGNKKFFPRVHLLVASAFNGERPDGLVCAHLDGNKLNNTPENLQWVTAKENESHKWIHGTMPKRDWHGRFIKIKNKQNVS